jgi:VWFA-related protein
MILRAVVAAAILAQAAAPPHPDPPAALQGQRPSQPPVIRSGVTLVQVDAIVTDKDGRFVGDLSPADFELLEEGAPQSIQTFSLIRSSTSPVAGRGPAAAATDAIAQPLAPTVQRVFVLMFDEEHVRPGAFDRLRGAALRFLDRDFREGDIGGLVVSRRMVNNRLTPSREELKQALKSARPSGEQRSREIDRREWPRIASDAEAARIAAGDREAIALAVQRACAEDPTLCRRVDPEPQIREKARFMADQEHAAAGRTLTALRALASGLERVPGRKTIVLMTDGFFANESWETLQQIVGLAARSNARIYAVDARGTDVHGQSEHLSEGSIADPFGGPPAGVYDASTDGPNALAAGTGAFVVRNTNNFDDALRDIARDTSDYYVLGYVPASAAAEGTFRRVEVKVRRSGVTVRARGGYIAGPARPSTVESKTPPDGTTPSPPTTTAPGPPALPIEGTPRQSGLRVDSTDRIRDLMQRGRMSEAATPTGIRAAPDGAGNDAAKLGWEAYLRGDLEAAERALTQAAAAPDSPAWVHYALGQAQFALSRFREAATAWTVVRKAAPEFDAVYFDLADAWLQLDDVGAAIEVLHAAKTRWPANPEVLNALGVAQVRNGTVDAAIRTFTRAIEVAPEDSIAEYNLARTYELRFVRSRRYVTSMKRWIANDDDRRAALEHYERYISQGGPFVASAREAILRLEWAQQQ